MQWDRYETDRLGSFVFKFGFPVNQAMIDEVVVFAVFGQAVSAGLPCLEVRFPESSFFSKVLFSVLCLHDMPPDGFGISAYGLKMEFKEGLY